MLFRNRASSNLYQPQIANLKNDGRIFGRIKRRKASEFAFRSQKLMAGAEGLEPSARGFGATVESSKPHR